MSHLTVLETRLTLQVDPGIVPTMELFPWRLASVAGKTFRCYVPLYHLTRNLYALKVSVLCYKMRDLGPSHEQRLADLCEQAIRDRNREAQTILYMNAKALRRLRTKDGDNMDLRLDNIPLHLLDRSIALADVEEPAKPSDLPSEPTHEAPTITGKDVLL